jgi:hypothetical protein
MQAPLPGNRTIAPIDGITPEAKGQIEMNYDPDEDVTLNGAKMSLRSAVAKVMALSPDDRMGVTIFRNGEPPILDRAEIEDIADLPGFQDIPESDGAEHRIRIAERQQKPRSWSHARRPDDVRARRRAGSSVRQMNYTHPNRGILDFAARMFISRRSPELHPVEGRRGFFVCPGRPTSALLRKTDSGRTSRHVRKVP